MTLRIYGNRQLKTLPGQATRPTPARVRAALFNIWQGEIEGCHWLDLCAGSGAMGAEALGRGAALAVGIEQSGRACAVIEQNWQQVACEHQIFRVVRGEVVQQLSRLAGQQFDRIYFDPPYASPLYAPVFAAICCHQLLALDGELAIEHHPDRRPAEWESAAIEPHAAPPRLMICRQKVYGNTALTCYCLNADCE
jgi:16S rRNA (guanine966-N2)-methyltransferase